MTGNRRRSKFPSSSPSFSYLVLENGGGRGREQRRRTRTSALSLILTILVLVGAIPLRAAVAPVSVNVPEPKAYTGQRLPFFVELRSKGSFGGATSFTLPQVSGVVIVKVGNPVVSSEQLEGESWFVQSHEFALFSQRDGAVEIPAFPVHFGTREGFSGPVTEVADEVPAFQVEIDRPAGTDPARFLVTTESLSVAEKWDPLPGEIVKTGAVFKRTITQRAENMTGMALAPAPITAPDGIRVYPGTAEVTDQTERGEFSGQRIETITYLVERPGRYSLPAIRYDWWNPTTKKLESKTLPGATFTATAPPETVAKEVPAKRSFARVLWLLILLGLIVICWLGRRSLAAPLSRFHDRIDPPDQRATRSLLHACRQNDAHAAARTWAKWKRLQPGFSPRGELQVQLIELQRHLYGPTPEPGSWRGSALASAFREFGRSTVSSRTASLPPLNP